MATDVRDRLLAHRAALEIFGLPDISALPSMTIAGDVLVSLTGGLTSPRLSTLYIGDAVVRSSSRPAGGGSGDWQEVHDTPARMMNAEFPQAPLPLPSTYWVASEIRLESGTVVLLPHPLAYLTVLTERLVIGDNVVFTWQRPDLPVPVERQPPEGRPDRPAPMPDGSYGAPGEHGWGGDIGNRGLRGGDGPRVELWALEMSGRPAFDVRGQDAGQGGRGQPGGAGGRGGKGRPSHSTWVDCRRGPGHGGRGGDGGLGGPGGQGGDGGTGGSLGLFMPADTLKPYLGGFVVEVSGGAGGRGGDPGRGGPGVAGGEPGNASGRCSPTPDRRGAEGSRGHDGPVGEAGHPGGTNAEAIQLNEIDPADFRRAITAPAITDVLPPVANVGDHVVISGLRLLPDDELLVNDQPTPFTFVADTMAQFVLPAMWGGPAEIRFRQTDGTLSNAAGLLVAPTVSAADPAERVLPGNRVVLTGTGFAPQMRVYGGDEDMDEVTVLDPQRLEFTIRRPSGTQRNGIAEIVDVAVALPTGQRSESIIRLSLDTYRIAVLGDSVAWGQGLLDANRTSTLVARSLDARWTGTRGVYVDSRAHSGAVIGVRINEELSPLPGEVPTGFPTILQQLTGFTADPQGVDLVLLDGGINDIDVRTILKPWQSDAEMLRKIDGACREDMTVLLDRTLNHFPSAKVVVTSYFPILSKDSDLWGVPGLLLAMGVPSPPPLTAVALKLIVDRCELAYAKMTEALQAAVDAVNAARPGPRRVGLACPPFTSANAALSPHAWLFGLRFLSDPTGLNFDPDDDPAVAGPRATACEIAGNQDRTGVLTCKYASVGHPNPVGAGQFAQAVLAELADLDGAVPTDDMAGRLKQV